MGGIANFNPGAGGEIDRQDKLRALAEKEELAREALAGLPRRRWWQWRLSRRDLKEHLKAG